MKNAHAHYPMGYWAGVYRISAALQEKHPKLDGTTAYWLARRRADKLVAQLQLPEPVGGVPKPPPLRLTG